MSTAPQVGSQSEHDWLVVGTTTAPSHVAPSTTWQQRLGALISGAMEPLGSLNQYLSRRVRRERRGRYRSASQSSGAIFPQFVAPPSATGSLESAIMLTASGAGCVKGSSAWLRAHPIVAMFALGTIFPLAYLIYCIATVPSDGGLVIEPTPSALVVEADGGQVFATRGVFKGDKLSSEDVPPNLSRAIIAIEDRHFYDHTGIYLPSLLRAAYRNFLSGSAREGGSTITQQLVRMTYLSQERTIKRKVQEAILTYWIEHQLPKQEILTRYLNTAYFGAGVYGVDAAARRYFGKTAKELSLSESAMLAGLVRAPSALAPTRNLEARGSGPVWCSMPWLRLAPYRASRQMPLASSRPLCGCPGQPAGNKLLRGHAQRGLEEARRFRIRKI